MTLNRITFISGNEELLNGIQLLWEGLNSHHQSVSPYFAADFDTYTFKERVAKLYKKCASGKLRVDVARDDAHAVGYVVCTVSGDGVGEIESIFVEDDYQRQAIGDELMRRALSWMDTCSANTRVVAVATGNEGVFDFYARYGFYPRMTLLQQINCANNLADDGYE